MAEHHTSRPTRGRISTRGGRRGASQTAVQGQGEIVPQVNVGGPSPLATAGVTDPLLAGADLGDVARGMVVGQANSSPPSQQLVPMGEQEEEKEVNLYTWCEQCGMNTIGDCFVHGKVISVTDNKLPSRARLSLPSVLILKKVKNQDGGQEKEGVFAKRLIKPRTQFGPLEAPLLQEGVALPPDVFDVRVLKSEHQECLDLSQEETCNWMMFVRPAHTSQESNLAAYQLQDHIYYIATKSIAQMVELRVWYLQSYGQQFGKQPLPSVLPQMQVLPESGSECDAAIVDVSPERAMTAVGTRSAAAPAPGKLVCEACSTAFRSFPQLVAHNCRAINEPLATDASTRLARRKGRPRKVGGATGKKGKGASGEASRTPTCVAPVSTTPVSTNTTTALPSVTTLIKTEVKGEAVMPDSTGSEAQGERVVRRRRGRPRGSKNKVPAQGETRPPRKPLDNHKRKRPRLDCPYCQRSFYSQEQHRVHVAEHTGTKPYVCHFSHCGKGFGSKFKYLRHILVHEQPQNRKCPYCDRSFNRVDHLKNHTRTHSSNRQMWSCSKCGKQYLYHSTYIYHLAWHDAKEGVDLTCRICSQACPSRQALVEHVQTHNRYKPDPNRSKNHQCHKCLKKFTTAKDVRRHMVTHTKDRSFLCEFCPQTFARKDHLRRHYKSNHKKEVLEQAAANNSGNPCSVCLKQFKSPKHLQYHMQSAHSQEGASGAGGKRVSKSMQFHSQGDNLGEGMQAKSALTIKMEGDGHQPSVLEVLNPEGSRVVVMQRSSKMTVPGLCHIPQQQHLVQQQLSVLPQSIGQADSLHPVQIHVSQPHSQSQDVNPVQPQSLPPSAALLQPAPFIANLPPGSGAQPLEVVAAGTAEGADHFSPHMLTLKTIPCRFPAGPILASVQTGQGQTTTSSAAQQQLQSATNLRQILNYTQPQQQQETQPTQQTQPQQQEGQQQADLHSMPTIVSMLATSRGDNFLDLAGKGQAVFAQDSLGQLKVLPSGGWVLAGNTHALPEPSSMQGGSESGDHCYATGVTGSAAAAVSGDVGLKLSPLPSLGSKIMGSVGPISELDTLRLLQSCQAGSLGLGAAAQPLTTSQPPTSQPNSGLQTSWDTLSDLGTIPLSEMMIPLTGSQVSAINLPVTVSVPISDGSGSVSASVTLSQPS